MRAAALSVRWRLTIVYAAVSVASASVLLAGIYVLVSLQQGRTLVVGGDTLGDTAFRSEVTAPPPGEGDVMIRKAILTAREDAVDGTLHNLLVWSGLGLLAMALVSVAVGWVVAGRALAPVHTITSRARRISADSLDERLRLDGPQDELREMADTFDELLDRLQGTVDSERRLVATMSHELRTPLANQRTTLDVALGDPAADAPTLRRAGEVALAQVERAQRTVDALLTLARVQAGAAPAELGPVQVDELARSAVAEGEAADDGIVWQVDVEPATVAGDADLLGRAVDNLLRNAVAHNLPPGAEESRWVAVRLAVDPVGVVLTVENSGPVLDAAAVDDLVLPFRRGTTDRTASARGAGLGLSIVQSVAEHHGATLRLTARPGGGLRAELTLRHARIVDSSATSRPASV